MGTNHSTHKKIVSETRPQIYKGYDTIARRSRCLTTPKTQPTGRGDTYVTVVRHTKSKWHFCRGGWCSEISPEAQLRRNVAHLTRPAFTYATYHIALKQTPRISTRDNIIHTCSCSLEELDSFRTAVPFWGQPTQIRSSSSPKRDCGTIKRSENATPTVG